MSDNIRSHPINVGQAQIDDLHQRLKQTRWVNKETPDDWSQGIPLAYMREIHQTWLEDYDWRACEDKINAAGSFMTTIMDMDIHFLHVRSPHEGARPLILTHGWPGSILEFLKVIPLLTDPVVHGGSPEDAYHLVIPSIPGFGFSGKPTGTGWPVERMAEAWAELMARLNYDKYFAQGGDWGSLITTKLGQADPEHCMGVHINFIVALPDETMLADATPDEQARLAQFGEHGKWGTGYSKQMGTRPQTLGYGLVDSPIGQAAWVLEKFQAWSDCDGHPENALTRQELLDNVMIYWLTASAGSSGRIYWESLTNFVPTEFNLPLGGSIFKVDIIRPTRRWAEQWYKNIIFWADHDQGGHFAACEKPEMFVNDLRKCFGQIR
jgi:pimeloyl-ACP methyl ester carboxylesterase